MTVAQQPERCVEAVICALAYLDEHPESTSPHIVGRDVRGARDEEPLQDVSGSAAIGKMLERSAKFSIGIPLQAPRRTRSEHRHVRECRITRLGAGDPVRRAARRGGLRARGRRYSS